MSRRQTYQFAKGTTADATRIETSLDEVIALWNGVPDNALARQFVRTKRVFHWAPAQWFNQANGSFNLPFMAFLVNDQSRTPGYVTVGVPRQPYVNAQRVKSIYAGPLINPTFGRSLVSPDVFFTNTYFTLELSWLLPRATVLSRATVLAEANAGLMYDNRWKYGNGSPSRDVTFQVCVDDAFDTNNRKRLRQEALIYTQPSNIYDNLPGDGVSPPPDTLLPPIGSLSSQSWVGKVVDCSPLVALPEQARVRTQLTIPCYGDPADASWGDANPWLHNTWTVELELWERVRGGE